jgi:hydroxypyruvate isomerase
VSIQYSANLSMLWPDREPLDRFEAAARAGFCRVEMLFPQQIGTEAVHGKLTENDLQMSLFDFSAGDWAAGERGIAALPDRVDEFRELAVRDLAAAAAFGTRTMTVLAGIRPESVSTDEADAVLLSNLRAIAGAAAAQDVMVTVEAINNLDIPGFHVRTVEHAARVVGRVGLPNVRVQFDQYHVCREGQDPIAVLEEFFDVIAHIQIADAPGRHEPGTGTAPVHAFLERVQQLGYPGVVGLEYVPAGDTDAGLAWLPIGRRGA